MLELVRLRDNNLEFSSDFYFNYCDVFSLNYKLNTKRYVPKALISPFVGMVVAQTLARL